MGETPPPHRSKSDAIPGFNVRRTWIQNETGILGGREKGEPAGREVDRVT